MRKMRVILAALCLVSLCAIATPGATQEVAAASGSSEAFPASTSTIDAESAETTGPLLFPALCMACEASRQEAALDEARLPRGVTPLIGGVVGAVVGFAIVRLNCGEPGSCEMGDLFGILGGAVIGFSIGKTLEDMMP